jgi:trehalose 6-phosphate phosphatase
MARLAAATPGVHVEDKEHALALHYRAAPREAPRLSAAMSTIARDLAPGYEVLPGKAVFELRPASVSKGMAIESFIEESPFRGRRPVFIGDDVTDLDGFAAVERAGGVSIAVGDQLPALCRVASPAAVRRLLGDLAAGRPVMP